MNRINLDISLKINGAISRSRATFSVNPYQSKRNPEQVASKIAAKWIQELLRESRYLPAEVIKVQVNGEHDLTNLVKQTLWSYPDEDGLPF